jgi:hypothetical protein
LISESKVVASKEKKERKVKDKLASSLLGSCLANEIQIGPDLLGIAIEWYAKNSNSGLENVNTEIILRNKFGTAFRERVRECFFEKYDDKYSAPLGSVLADIFLSDLRDPENTITIQSVILAALKCETKEDKCTAILGMMGFAFKISRHFEKEINDISSYEEIFEILFDLLKLNDLHYQFSICWCIAWSSEAKLFPDKLRIPFVTYLVKFWIKSNDYALQRVNSWALSRILTPSIPKSKISKIQNLKNIIHKNFENPANEFDKLVSIYLGTIIGEEFEAKEILEEFKIKRIPRVDYIDDQSSSFVQFAKILGINLKELSQTKS